jgi:hypothetical protein
MVWKFSFAFYVVMIVAQLATAQSTAENILIGDVKANILQRYSGSEVLPKPNRVLIRDFTVPVGDVTTDTSVAGELHRRIMLQLGVDEDSSPEVLAQRVQTAFAETLAYELKKLNVPVQSASAAEAAVSGCDLVVEGKFIAINEGDKTKRIMVGFGRGASDIETHVTVSSEAQGQSTVVLEFNLSSESGKKPGAVATGGVGALAVAAAAGGDRNSTVEADASRMAKLVAKQLETFMADQRWISNSQRAVPIGEDEYEHDRD